MLYDHQESLCAQQVCWLPLERIAPRTSQPFAREDGASLGEMCESIRRDGMIHPITVRRSGEGCYTIVAGNRRYMACRMLGMTHIDAVVLPGVAQDEGMQEVLALLHSRHLHYLEEARALADLTERGLSREELARHLGITPATVREKLRLMELDEPLRVLLLEEGLPERMARAMLRLPDNRARMTIALRAAREHLSVRDVELLVTSAQTHLPVPPPPGGRTITLMRDHRLYLNAIRAIAAQMKEAGMAVQMTERTLPDAVEVTLRLPTRRRRRSQSGR